MTISPDPTIPDPIVAVFAELAKDLGKQVWVSTAGRAKKEGSYMLAARRYREAIIKQYGQIQVYGQIRPTPLLDIFTDVHVLSKPQAMRNYTIANLEEWSKQRERAISLHHREERRPGIDMLTETDKLYILGKPGSGKTTFLKYLAVWAAKGHVKLPRVPIFISLKEYSDTDESLLAFIGRQFAICDFSNARPFIERLLEKGSALVLFDGLDEVSEAGDLRKDVIADIRDFARQFGESTIVVTCRVAASEYTFEGFTYIEMADFTPDQVQNFVGRWFSEDDETRQRMLADLVKPDNQGILELTQNPLLLTLLCIAFEEIKVFPRRRVNVYEEGSRALLRQWDKSKGVERDRVYRDLSLGRKQEMLSRIAYNTFGRGEHFLQQRTLEKRLVDYLASALEAPEKVDIDGEAVLKAIAAQHGLLVERSRRIYSFSHLTFQEYFTARYIVDNEANGSLNELIAHATEDRWREVFLLVASLLDDADGFFERFVDDLGRFVVQKDFSKLFRWADETAQYLQKKIDADAKERGASPLHYSAAAMRLWILARDRDLARALDLDPDLALARDSDIARALLRDRMGYSDLDPDLVRTIGRAARNHNRNLTFVAVDRDLALDSDIARALLHVGADYCDLAPALVRTIGRAARDLRLTDFADALQEWVVPWGYLPRIASRVFYEQLLAIITTYRPSALVLWRLRREIEAKVGPPRFPVEHLQDLSTYLEIVHLLLDCLDVAYVTDRQAIEDQLFR